MVLAKLGFDVNAYGRGDAPVEEPWETALHHSAADGNVELTRRLLHLGADPDLRDQRFDATPLDWARHFHQQSAAALLEPITTPHTAANEAGPASGGRSRRRPTGRAGRPSNRQLSSATATPAPVRSSSSVRNSARLE
jgi:ankyrin repeat protein